MAKNALHHHPTDLAGYIFLVYHRNYWFDAGLYTGIRFDARRSQLRHYNHSAFDLLWGLLVGSDGVCSRIGGAALHFHIHCYFDSIWRSQEMGVLRFGD